MDESKSRRLEELEQLVRAHQAKLRTYIFTRVGSRDAADDLVQEVFVVVWKNFDRLDPARSPLPWLLGIARNEVRSYWRNKTRKDAREQLQEFASERLLQQDELEAHAVSSDRVDALRRCIDELPDKSRQLVSLIYKNHLNCEQVAQQIESSGSIIRMALYRLRRALRSCVELRLAKGDL